MFSKSYWKYPKNQGRLKEKNNSHPDSFFFYTHTLNKMIKTNKSQVIGQVFIYILAIIIFSVILLYGYKIIGSTTAKADQIKLLQFKTDITSIVKKTSLDYGSIIKKDFFVPERYKEVCFLDIDEIYDPNCDKNNYPLLCDGWEVGAKNNMFLLESDGSGIFYYIGKLKVLNSRHFECMNATHGSITIRLEGKGDYSQLSK